MNRPRRVFHFQRQEEATPQALRGATVVVIDVLRATSTMTAALAAGAREVRCFPSVAAARRARRTAAGRTGLLCGERNGRKVPGFDLGNSPGDFTPERCAGRTLLMTTTNGTRALGRTLQAREVVIGCFLNLSAVAEYLAVGRGDVALLCAGTEGEVSAEDVAFAGALAEEIAGNRLALTESAQEAVRVWRAARRSLTKFLAGSRGGVPLVKIGLGRDIRFCARRNRFDVVPRVVGRGQGVRVAAC
ncbi:MAG: 2-phosphosulfolactate phosphatase [Candidatus Brocadiia bacterium]|jgi:2-phosphosulfolactate phosphatase